MTFRVMAEHNILGEQGENDARQLLEKKGYSILAENWRSGHDELDLIAQTGNMVVFVEVKSRSTDRFGHPSLAVSRAKQKRIIRAANAYMQQKNVELEARFDVISIVYVKGNPRIEHIEDAFFPLA